MAGIDAFRDIASGADPMARVYPESHRARDGRYRHRGWLIDARTLVTDWDGLVARAESAERDAAALRAAIAALTKNGE